MQIPDDALPLLIRALEHYADYMRATRRDGKPFRELAEQIQRKPVESEKERPAKAKRNA